MPCVVKTREGRARRAFNDNANQVYEKLIEDKKAEAVDEEMKKNKPKGIQLLRFEACYDRATKSDELNKIIKRAVVAHGQSPSSRGASSTRLRLPLGRRAWWRLTLPKNGLTSTPMTTTSLPRSSQSPTRTFLVGAQKPRNIHRA